MLIRIWIYAFALINCFTFAAFAQTEIISEEAEQTHLTIYTGDLGLITERRRVTLPKGQSRIIFNNLSNEIIPQSMSLKEFEGFVLEKDFDTDLLNKSSLFKKSIGKTVELVTIDPNSAHITSKSAKIINSDEQRGVVFDIDGKIETLQCSGLSERVRFNGVPENLHPLPRLSLLVSSETGGEADFIFSYLSQGLKWEADYRVNMQSKDTANLLGWMSVQNKTGLNFKDISLSVVAGNLNRQFEQPKLGLVQNMLYASCWPKGSTKTAFDPNMRFPQINAVRYKARNVTQSGEALPMSIPASSSQMIVSGKVVPTAYAEVTIAATEDLGEYKLYRVPNLLDLPAQSQKQIAFINERNIEISSVYKVVNNRALYGKQQKPDPWQITPFKFLKYLVIENSKESTLTTSLPRGTIRLFDLTEDGRLAFFGQGKTKDSIPGEPIEIAIEAQDNLSLMRLSRRVIIDGQDAMRVTYRVRNPSSEPVLAHIIEVATLGPPSSVVDKSVEPIYRQGRKVWPVEVPANSEGDVRFSSLFGYYDKISLHSFNNDLLSSSHQSGKLSEKIDTDYQEYKHFFPVQNITNILGSISLPPGFAQLPFMAGENIEDIDACFPNVQSRQCGTYIQNYKDIIEERDSTKIVDSYNRKTAIKLKTLYRRSNETHKDIFDVIHTITNVTDSPRRVVVNTGSNSKPFFKGIELLKTSHPRSDDRYQTWTLEIDPKETINLEYTMQFQGR